MKTVSCTKVVYANRGVLMDRVVECINGFIDDARAGDVTEDQAELMHNACVKVLHKDLCQCKGRKP